MKTQLARACMPVLRDVFGVDGFRPGQKEAAQCLLSGRDLLCILPTGAGKSLCWQLPAVVHTGLTVVVSPLIALMHDQVAGLRRRGIPAVTINSIMSPQERQEAERQILSGAARILMVSPERLASPTLRRLCRTCPPWLVVVDEAHCVVEWGEEFRPAYRQIDRFIASLDCRPVICAMTATADPRMQRQIVRDLGMRRRRRVMLPLVRGNLQYSVRTAADSDQEILRLVMEDPCRTVIFCATRRRTEALAGMLRRSGLLAEHYHAGLSREERFAVQKRFADSRTQILAATVAFGMGVDIPDIRCIIHDGLPGSITDLAQQSGRAGRDGSPARCFVVISPWDVFLRARSLRAQRIRTRWDIPQRLRMLRRDWWPLRRLLQLLLRRKCIPQGIAAAFGHRAGRCGRCSACLNGAPRMAVPDLLRANEMQLSAWFIRWQRSAMAARRQIRPGDLIPDEDLMAIARRCSLADVPDEALRRELQPLVRALRRLRMADGGMNDG